MKKSFALLVIVLFSPVIVAIVFGGLLGWGLAWSVEQWFKP